LQELHTKFYENPSEVLKHVNKEEIAAVRCYPYMQVLLFIAKNGKKAL
jgi:hypothetical protein